MPNTRSAKKRLRQNEVRRTRNRAALRSVRSQIRKVREALAAGDLETSESEFRAAARQLDKAAAKGIVKPNTAARKKSRLSAAIKTAKSTT